MEKNTTECEGCREHELLSDEELCMWKDVGGKSNECVCQNCLIKSICINACSDWIKFIDRHMRKNNEKCEGCLTYKESSDNPNIKMCVHLEETNISGCPCQNCLIKVTCSTICAELETFFRFKIKNIKHRGEIAYGW
jgi:hypothetical protein